MKKSGFLVGLLALVLVVGVFVLGCENGTNSATSNNTSGINVLDFLEFTTTQPGENELSIAGLTLEQFNQIRDAGGGGYLGWFIDEESTWSIPEGSDPILIYKREILHLIWSGRTLSHFTTVADLLDQLFEEDDRGIEDNIYYSYGDVYLLTFLFIREELGEGAYFPAGTMWATFWADDTP